MSATTAAIQCIFQNALVCVSIFSVFVADTATDVVFLKCQKIFMTPGHDRDGQTNRDRNRNSDSDSNSDREREDESRFLFQKRRKPRK